MIEAPDIQVNQKINIAHIINPVKVEAGNRSYLDIAQPITFQSMLNAQAYTRNSSSDIEVTLYTAQYPEDREIIPEGFVITSDLERSANTVFNIKKPNKKLPLLGDIIGKLYENSDAEYFIYTNADIGVKPDFYVRVVALIKKGHDGICIHRQDFPKSDGKGIYDLSRLGEIVQINTKREHPGHDCVVFRRDMVPSMMFKKVFVGYPPIGAVIKTQVKKNSKNFTELRSQCRMTFHLGNDKAWEKSNGNNGEYNRFNMDEGKGLYTWR